MSFLERLWRRVTARPSPTAAAEEANARGNEAASAGDAAGAERWYREAARLDPRWAAPWFNLGLLHKGARRWTASLDASRRAVALDPGHAAATWNLGIAATALGDWPEARRAWRGYGMDVPDGEGPIEMKLGPVPIRLVDEEVVWCVRLDPARARIDSVPFPESGRCRGDVLLHDGAPHGYRTIGDREFPVFEELALLAASRLSTWTVDVDVADPGSAAALVSAFARRGLSAEDWTTQVRLLCKACSEGRTHARGEEPPAAGWSRAHAPVELGLAADGRSG